MGPAGGPCQVGVRDAVSGGDLDRRAAHRRLASPRPTLGEPPRQLVPVLGEVAGDVAQVELRQDRGRRLALEQEFERRSDQPLGVLALELRPLGDRDEMARLEAAVANADAEPPGSDRLDLDLRMSQKLPPG